MSQEHEPSESGLAIERAAHELIRHYGPADAARIARERAELRRHYPPRRKRFQTESRPRPNLIGPSLARSVDLTVDSKGGGFLRILSGSQPGAAMAILRGEADKRCA